MMTKIFNNFHYMCNLLVCIIVLRQFLKTEALPTKSGKEATYKLKQPVDGESYEKMVYAKNTAEYGNSKTDELLQNIVSVDTKNSMNKLVQLDGALVSSNQGKTVFIWYGLFCVVAFTVLIFVLCYVKEYCKKRYRKISKKYCPEEQICCELENQTALPSEKSEPFDKTFHPLACPLHSPSLSTKQYVSMFPKTHV